MKRHRYTQEELESALNQSDDEDYDDDDEMMDDYNHQEEEEEEEEEDEDEEAERGQCESKPYSNIKVLTFKPSEPLVTFTDTSLMNRKWNNTSTLLLLSLYKKYKQEFTYRPKRDVWDIISRELRTKGYDISGHYCYEKFRNMVRTTRHVREKLSKSDGTTKINVKFPYYYEMAELLQEMPEIRTPTVFESSEGHIRSMTFGGETSKRNTPTASTCQQTEDTERDWFKEWIALKRELDQNKERRHRENMEIKRAILEKLTKLEERGIKRDA